MTLGYRETADEIILFFADAIVADDVRILDVDDAGDFYQRVARTANGMVFDFRGIQFMTSGMINELLRVSKPIKQHSLTIRARNVSSNLNRLFEIARFDKLFRMDDDGPGLLGAGVPKPKPPGKFDGSAES